MRARALHWGVAALAALVCASTACAAGPKLYDTGPAQDAAYIRFINATGQPLQIVSSAAQGRKSTRLSIAPSSPASEFMPVKPKSPLAGRVEQGAGGIDIAPTAKPGELVSVVVYTDSGGGVAAEVVAELPKDFNGLKASLAFYNFDAGCGGAGLAVASRDTLIFENAIPRSVQRRAVNPVALSVQPQCGTQNAGSALDLGILEAGQRYSVFMVAGAQGRRAFWIKDMLSP